MTHSICREPNVGYIAQKYGLNSPEGRGVMTTYVVGTLVGTIFMGVMASFLATINILHPLRVGYGLWRRKRQYDGSIFSIPGCSLPGDG